MRIDGRNLPQMVLRFFACAGLGEKDTEEQVRLRTLLLNSGQLRGGRAVKDPKHRHRSGRSGLRHRGLPDARCDLPQVRPASGQSGRGRPCRPADGGAAGYSNSGGIEHLDDGFAGPGQSFPPERRAIGGRPA